MELDASLLLNAWNSNTIIPVKVVIIEVTEDSTHKWEVPVKYLLNLWNKTWVQIIKAYFRQFRHRLKLKSLQIISGASGYYLQNQGNLLRGIAIWLGLLDLWYKERTWIPFSNNFSLTWKKKQFLQTLSAIYGFHSKKCYCEENKCKQKGCNLLNTYYLLAVLLTMPINKLPCSSYQSWLVRRPNLIFFRVCDRCLMMLLMPLMVTVFFPIMLSAINLLHLFVNFSACSETCVWLKKMFNFLILGVKFSQK